MEHRFQPTHYFRSFGSHEPVPRSAPGDRIVTTTADAFGRDANGEEVTEPGNPQTGPGTRMMREPSHRRRRERETSGKRIY